jgi:hypothetical protein
VFVLGISQVETQGHAFQFALIAPMMRCAAPPGSGGSVRRMCAVRTSQQPRAVRTEEPAHRMVGPVGFEPTTKGSRVRDEPFHIPPRSIAQPRLGAGP